MQKVINNSREKSLELINLEIMHKMKHLLMIVQTSSTNLNEYLPGLIQTYQIAKSHQLNVGDFQQRSLEILRSIVVSTKQEVRRAKFMLDLFNFMMLQEDQWMVNTKKTISVKSVWQSAVVNYPFINEQQQTQIIGDTFDDFLVIADAMLLEKIFLMLLNNIHRRMGNEDVWQLIVKTRKDEKWNYLLLQDNGDILSAEILPYLFDWIYYTAQEMQLGYFPCRKGLQLMGGEITCFVTEQKKTVFQVQFPIINI